MTTPIQNQLQFVQRGCGFPIAGGTYMFIPSGEGGLPIWNMLIDPVLPIPDPEGFGISKIGMKIIENNGIPHIWDWIGEGAYPNVLDWLFEIAKFGFHQKVDPKLLSKLTDQSYYIGVHPQASIEDPVEHYAHYMAVGSYPVCPKNYPQHLHPAPDLYDTCPGLFINDIIDGVKIHPDGRRVKRTMPAFEYEGYEPPCNAPHIPGAFIKIPIGRMMRVLVYEDKAMNTHEVALKELDKLDAKLKRVSTVPWQGG